MQEANTRRLALSALDLQALRDLADSARIQLSDRRSRDPVLDALSDEDIVAWETLLSYCSRDDLKAMCRATGRPDDGREKALLIERLLSDAPPAPSQGRADDIEGEWRLRVLQLLLRDELKELLDRYSVTNVDRRNAGAMATALQSVPATLADLLSDISRTRLKEVARVLGIDDSGRERAVILARLANKGGELGPATTAAYAPDITRELVATLLGVTEQSDDKGGLWPMAAALEANGQHIELDLYVRRVGPSRTPAERRFQNPDAGRPVVPREGVLALMLGLWFEQGEARTSVVAFDAYRRARLETRFSLFAPLSVLESAADSGFASHTSQSGEIVYAFRPENLTRYIDELNKTAPAPPPVLARAVATAPVPKRPISSATLSAVSQDSVEIRPKAGMFAAFARLNYKPWFALAELVDNAVQSYLVHQARLEPLTPGPLVLDIKLDDGELSVLDRAAGIPFSEFGRAFSPATPPADTTGLSEFGLGMKASASWFAREWSVRTTALGDPHERTVSFDVEKISREGLDHLPIERRDARPEDHYTEVTMRRLRQPPRANTLAKMKEHLASIYRLLIEDGTLLLRFTSGGRQEELRYEVPTLLTAPPWNAPNAAPLLWRKQLNVELNEKRITGWAGLLENGKFAKAGFAVFRRRRLIEGSVGEAYRPHLVFGAPNSFVSQRLVGELYVDGFEVTHTKDGVQWGSDEEDLLYELRRQLDSDEMPLLRQAQNFRARNVASKLNPTFGAEAVEALADALSSVDMAEAMARTPDEPENSFEHVDRHQPPEVIMQSRRFRMQVHADKTWNIEVRTIRDAAAPWLDSTTVTDERGSPTVIFSINLDHVFSEEHLNGDERTLEPVMHLAACLGIAEQQARLQGIKNPGAVRKNLNEMLRGKYAHLPPTEGTDR